MPRSMRRLVEVTSDETLDGINGVLRVDHSLSLRGLTDEAFAVLVERHHRRAEPSALRGGDDRRLSAFHDGDNAVGGTKVDANDFAHGVSPLLLRFTF
jgi:hypothetical protein